MPRKAAEDPDRKWVTFDIPINDWKTLAAAADEDGRPLKEYLKLVVAGHVALLTVTDKNTRKQLSSLSNFPVEDQGRILGRVGEQFQQYLAKGRGKS